MLHGPYNRAFTYFCLSTDIKPTLNVEGGSELLETDTGYTYKFDGTTWHQFIVTVTSTGGSSSVTVTNFPSSIAVSNFPAGSGGDPLASYICSDLDENIGGNSYYGFIDVAGNWYIMRVTAVDIRYVKGSSEYTTNWTGRMSLTYNYYNIVFA